MSIYSNKTNLVRMSMYVFRSLLKVVSIGNYWLAVSCEVYQSISIELVSGIFYLGFRSVTKRWYCCITKAHEYILCAFPGLCGINNHKYESTQVL